jgi:eukaryotic-like serine/threonine-protein kinase
MAERSASLNFSAVSADDAKVVAATGPVLKPERFGRYVLLDRIGSGGMAEVFRAVMPGAEGFRQTFVVKRILAERSRAPDFVEMFVQEARIGALLSHPNIVQVFDFGTVGGDYFLAMEYLRGRDVQALMRKLRRENLLCPVPVAAFIAHEVAVCLGYAHDLVGPDGKRLHIVHRDVSPSNIMCLRTGGVKLLDFGIAKAAGEQSENTEHGLFKGKLAYVAPERIKNEPLDGRVDLFGLGVVLWEMLTGRRLFRGKNELETLKNVLEMQVPPPSAHRPDVPASLDAVVMRALARDRATRYPTGQAMADDLEPILRETGSHPKMLADLLREAFATDVARSQESLSIVTPEMLAKLTEDVEPGTGTLSSSSGNKRRQWSPQRGFGMVGAAAVTATLAGLLLARGGGGSSHAEVRTPAPPAAVTVPAIDPIPPPAGAPPARATPPEPPVAEPAPASPTGGAAPEAGRQRSKRPHRRRDRTKAEAATTTGDRVVRGLSVDPFAEEQRGGKP